MKHAHVCLKHTSESEVGDPLGVIHLVSGKEVGRELQHVWRKLNPGKSCHKTALVHAEMQTEMEGNPCRNGKHLPKGWNARTYEIEKVAGKHLQVFYNCSSNTWQHVAEENAFNGEGTGTGWVITKATQISQPHIGKPHHKKKRKSSDNVTRGGGGGTPCP